MKKMKQKELKNLVATGQAVDITTTQDLPQDLKKIASSFGVYGANGALYIDKQGYLYAITKRTTNLFRI